VAEGLPELLGDPVQLGQVVRNIVMNAAQAMPNGGEIALGADYNSQTNMLRTRA
jgi:signal transduction histidine kinase